MHLFTIVLVALVLALLAQAGLFAYFSVRYNTQRRAGLQPQTREPRVEVDPPAPRRQALKCHIKTFAYADGHIVTKHSECEDLGLDTLTDEAAQRFYPISRLKHVSNNTHHVAPR